MPGGCSQHLAPVLSVLLQGCPQVQVSGLSAQLASVLHPDPTGLKWFGVLLPGITVSTQCGPGFVTLNTGNTQTVSSCEKGRPAAW